MKSNLIRTVTACTLICIPLLTACGSSKDLDTYQENMTAFITETTAIRDNIDAIDTESGDAGSTLLVELDKLDEEFKKMAEFDVPAEFSANESLADEASTYMTESVKLYHEYFDDPEAGEEICDAAYENYKRAFTRISYISSILQGNIPEGENVTVTEDEQTDFDPVTAEDEFSY